MENKVDRCIILMAGKGTRFLPATRAVAKELFPIANKPALLYQLQEVYKSGIKKVCIVISKEKKIVKKFLSHNKKLEKTLQNAGKMHFLEELNEIIDNMQIDFVYQGKMSGSGGAIYSAKKWTEGKPFGVFYGDDFCLAPKNELPVIGQLASAYEKTYKIVVGARPLPMETIHLYSSIVKEKQLFDRCFSMSKIIEKPKPGTAPSNLVGLARFILTPEVFDEILKTTPASNGEIFLTDVINRMAEKGRVVSYEFNAKYFDCGNKLEYVKCIIDNALEDKEISEKLKQYLKEIK